ncbi:MAG: GNAT family N-acetyltransferase [Deltaproteobacteria bacterium]|nr:GNAT family N-acetyltransferase [Deltaproteobacteria bacterium]
MAYTQMLRIDRIGPDELDLLLARGFFRMHQGVFTCTFLSDEDGLHSVVWTRRPLQGAPLPASARRRLRRVQQRMRVVVQPCRLDAEREELYSRYFQHVGGNRSETLRGVLFGDEAVEAASARARARAEAGEQDARLDDMIDALLEEMAEDQRVADPRAPIPAASADEDDADEPSGPRPRALRLDLDEAVFDLPTAPTRARAARAAGRLPGDRFDSWEVTIRDGGRLVGYSIFDIGHDSMESIIGVYDPDYARFGLGAVTMLVEIEWGAAAGFQWHYAGYIVPGVQAFEYKRDVGYLQFWDTEAELWRPISALEPSDLAGPRIERALAVAGEALRAAGYPTERVLNSPYRVVQLNNGAHQFIGEPYLLRWGGAGGGLQRVITYDLYTHRYQVDLCLPSRDLSQVLPHAEVQGQACQTRLLHRLKRVGATADPHQLAALLEASLR